MPLTEPDLLREAETLCPDPAFMNLAAWGAEGSFGQQMTHPDAQLYNDAGNLIDGHVLNRATLYLHFGFGAEAKQVAKLSPELERSHPHLYDLADIFDYGRARAPRMLHKFANCESDLALWGILAADNSSTTTPVNTKAALRGLENLPVHLRGFVGRELSKRLIERGDPESASIALRSSERMTPKNATDASLAKAMISETYGNREASTEVLKEVISQNSAESPKALIALVEQYLDSGQTVPPEIALAIEAFLFEFRNTPIGNDLTRAHILASANSGQFSKAFKAFQAAMIDNILVDPRDTESRLLAALASRAEDIVFLEHAFDTSLTRGRNVDQDALLSVAERLLSLGFTDQAETVLLSADHDKFARKQRVLEARIHLTKGNAGSALSQLSDLEGRDVELLRAEALRISGENSASQAAFLSANDPLGAAITGWTAENWTPLVTPDDPIFGPVKTLAEEQISQITAGETLLSDTERALQSAEDARRALGDLLNAVGSL
jgi:tetratricopeptide (TPR) repeat protein